MTGMPGPAFANKITAHLAPRRVPIAAMGRFRLSRSPPRDPSEHLGEAGAQRPDGQSGEERGERTGQRGADSGPFPSLRRVPSPSEVAMRQIVMEARVVATQLA